MRSAFSHLSRDVVHQARPEHVEPSRGRTGLKEELKRVLDIEMPAMKGQKHNRKRASPTRNCLSRIEQRVEEHMGPRGRVG